MATISQRSYSYDQPLDSSPCLHVVPAPDWSHAAWPDRDVVHTRAAAAASPVIYVNKAAAPGGNGASWATAFKYLQDGLAAASDGTDIWVAQGTYYPDEGAGITPDDRAATFRLKSHVAIYGGFVGTETSLDQRDWEAHPSVLSGDIDQDPTTDVCGPCLRGCPATPVKTATM